MNTYTEKEKKQTPFNWLKAEINDENKEKFFALYWGQRVLEARNVLDSIYGPWKIDEFSLRCVDGHLELRYISPFFLHHFGFLGLKFFRALGFLVPWNGLSCEEMIEAGWVKYKGWAKNKYK